MIKNNPYDEFGYDHKRALKLLNKKELREYCDILFYQGKKYRKLVVDALNLVKQIK